MKCYGRTTPQQRYQDLWLSSNTLNNDKSCLSSSNLLFTSTVQQLHLIHSANALTGQIYTDSLKRRKCYLLPRIHPYVRFHSASIRLQDRHRNSPKIRPFIIKITIITIIIIIIITLLSIYAALNNEGFLCSSSETRFDGQSFTLQVSVSIYL